MLGEHLEKSRLSLTQTSLSGSWAGLGNKANLAGTEFWGYNLKSCPRVPKLCMFNWVGCSKVTLQMCGAQKSESGDPHQCSGIVINVIARL